MGNEARLIDANAAMLNTHKEIYWTESEAAAVRNFLVHQPTIDPETLRPKGRWKLNKDGSGTCSECHRTRNDVWDMDNWDNFCSHCGADMREG